MSAAPYPPKDNVNTQNVNYGFTHSEGNYPPQQYGMNPTAPSSMNPTAPPSYSTAAAPPPMGDAKNQVELPYAPPPYPGFYVPLPVDAPPPFEAAVSGMYPSAPPGSPPPVYTPPLQPQPIAGQPTIVQPPVTLGKVRIEATGVIFIVSLYLFHVSLRMICKMFN